MPVFVVLAHDDPAMLRRLVGRLGAHPIHVHIDAKTDLDDFDSVAKITSSRTAQYVRTRSRLNWGGWSIVEGMAHSVDQALSDTSVDDHVVFLSGRCYPVRPVAEFVNHLASSRWRVHARAHAVTGPGEDHRWRYERRHGFDSWAARFGARGSLSRRAMRNAWSRLRSIGYAKEVPVHVAIGSQWMALPRDCAQEAVASVRTQQREWFLDSFAPDEIAFQTFIYNSRWAAETEFRKLEPRVASVSEIPNFHIVDANLTGRIDWAMALQPPERAFFARKFDSSRDADLLSEIDRRVE